MNYSFDVSKWLKLVLPACYRKTRLIAFFEALLCPLQSLHTSFVKFKNDILFRTSYNSQQGSLIALLNKVFADDIHAKRFTILTVSELKRKYFAPVSTDNSDLEPDLYVGLGTESREPIYVGLAYEYDNIYFLVYAPSEVIGRETEIKAWVNYYKFAGKSFKIIYF
jgi:hypothetical protein